MKWVNASKDNAGYSVYHCTPDRDPNTLYVIRQKRKTDTFTPIGWRVFVRTDPKMALQTIYVAETLKEAKAYVADWEQQLEHT